MQGRGTREVLQLSTPKGAVSALWERPPGATAVLVLAHGAGAGMRHAFIEALAAALLERGIACLRYQFPYMEAGRRGPDRPPTLVATVAAAVDMAAGLASDLPLFAGGKSLGGRMTSLAAAQGEISAAQGLVYVGFPLHAPGKPSSDRATHLSQIDRPMLFLQGTRDKLAEMDLIEPLCRSLGERATLHVVDGADHSFHVLKRSGRTDEQILQELAEVAAAWAQGARFRRSSTEA